MPAPPAPCQRSAASSAPPVRAHVRPALQRLYLPRSRRVDFRADERIGVPTAVSVGPVVGEMTHDRSPHAARTDQQDHLLDGRVDHARAPLASPRCRLRASERGQFPLHGSPRVRCRARPRDLGVSGIGAGLARQGPPRRRAANAPDHADGAIRSATTNTGFSRRRSRAFRAIGAVA